MSLFKRGLLLGLLLINLFLLVRETFDIVDYLATTELQLSNRFVSLELLYFHLFIENVILKIGVIILMVIVLLCNYRFHIRATNLLKQCIIFNLALILQVLIVCLLINNSFMDFLNIIYSDLICLGLIVSIILYQNHNFVVYEQSIRKLRFSLFILLIFTPILRIFAYGRMLFLFYLKPIFFLGVTGGLIFLTLVLLSIKDNDLYEAEHIPERRVLGFSSLYEIFLLTSISISSYFDWKKGYEILFALIVLCLIVKSLINPKKQQITFLLSVAYSMITFVYTIIFFIQYLSHQEFLYLLLPIVNLMILIFGVTSLILARFSVNKWLREF